jgi:hypothetical protein
MLMVSILKSKVIVIRLNHLLLEEKYFTGKDKYKLIMKGWKKSSYAFI